jgi:Na+-transporting NADH:ubiquinone oxidoreductase subunit C
MVSAAVVYLRPAQLAWAEIERSRMILELAGLLPEKEALPDRVVALRYRELDVRLVDLQSGVFEPGRDALTYDAIAASQQTSGGVEIPAAVDLARIGRRAQLEKVYLRLSDGALQRIVLPLRGQGMWAPIHGYIALEGDLVTIFGIAILEHGETPGIGDQIQSPAWCDSWSGKRAFDRHGRVLLAAAGSGRVPLALAPDHTFDAITGATVTVNAVTDMVSYWLGEHGFGPFLSRLRSGEFGVD